MLSILSERQYFHNCKESEHAKYFLSLVQISIADPTPLGSRSREIETTLSYTVFYYLDYELKYNVHSKYMGKIWCCLKHI